jgi:hypothetical protein
MDDGPAGASVERRAARRVAADAKDAELDKRLAPFGNGNPSEVASGGGRSLAKLTGVLPSRPVPLKPRSVEAVSKARSTLFQDTRPIVALTCVANSWKCRMSIARADLKEKRSHLPPAGVE